MKRALRLLLLLVLLLALVAGISGWWARRSWQAEKARLAAAGQLPTIAELIPPPIPEADNFAAVPALRADWENVAKARGRYEYHNASEFDPMPALSLKKPGEKSVAYSVDPTRQPLDFSPALAGFRHLDPLPGERPAETILRTLEAVAEPLRDISAGLRRPGCRFPIRYERTLYAVQPNFLFYRRLAQLYTLRAAASLEVGRADVAAEDLVSILRLGRHLRRDPGLTQLVNATGISVLATQFVWLGATRHAWSAAHLAAFEKELAGDDLFRDHARSLRLEAAVNVAVWESVVEEGDRATANLAAALSERTVRFLYGQTMFYPSLGVLARANARLLAALPGSRPERFQPAAFVQALAAIEADSARWSGTLIATTMVSHERIVLRLVAVQSRLELCLSAVRLEAQRVAGGRYPASLDGLAMPADLLTGLARRYEVSPDGARFRLLGQDWQLPNGDSTAQVLNKAPACQWYSNAEGAAAWPATAPSK